MSNKPLSAKRQHFCQEYVQCGHNATEAYRRAYPQCKSGHKQAGQRLLTNVDVKQEIARIEAEIRAEMRYDRETAVKLLRENLTHLTERVNKGDIGAIQARTAVIRELNAISNLHSSTVHTTEDKPLELTPEEARLYRDSAAIANRARIKSA